GRRAASQPGRVLRQQGAEAQPERRPTAER
ncbi:hypothetical protein AVDCRST_MAG82-1454, partial [uncultured Rubrobacteraceae bacterium]